MPEIGFDEEPTSPVRREDTVTKRKPSTTMRLAPTRFMCSGRASMIAITSAMLPITTTFIERS
jgi:hypothetical protein